MALNNKSALVKYASRCNVGCGFISYRPIRVMFIYDESSFDVGEIKH